MLPGSNCLIAVSYRLPGKLLIVRAFRRIPMEQSEGNMDPVKPLFEE